MQKRKGKIKPKLNIYKAPSNNVKLQSHKTLTTQIYLILTKQQMEFCFNETRHQVHKKRENNGAKFRNQSTFIKPIQKSSKSLKIISF